VIPHLPDRLSRFEPALHLAIEGRWNAAVRSVVQAVADPESEAAHGDEASDALGEIARLAADGGDAAAADEALIAALLIRPHDSDRLHQRAVVRLALGDHADARALLERALAVDPNHVSARLELSMMETRDGRLGEAVAGLRGMERAIAAVPREAADDEPLHSAGHPDLDLERARRDLADGRLDTAARRVDTLIERQPARADLHALRGAIEVRQGALDDAVASCGRALELDPDHAEARTRLAIALEGLGLRDQALVEIEHVLAAAPDHAEALALHERWSAGRKRARAREIPAPKRS
jgi:tetratricopeptide (TPR) repeat protein